MTDTAENPALLADRVAALEATMEQVKQNLSNAGHPIIVLTHEPVSTSTDVLRTDGPTLKEYVAAGYDASTYPPAGYAAKPEPETPAS